MKILWITNIVFPEALALIKGAGVLKSSGGWMLGASEALVGVPDVELVVATVSKEVKNLTCLEGENIKYYLLPYGKGNLRVNHDYETLWCKVRDTEKPDVVHIHGTEYSHGYSYIRACGADNVCVSIQGLVSAYSFYYYYGLSLKEILLSPTPASLLRGGVLKGYYDFKKRGKIETEIIRSVRHIIGRTSWDRERTWAINPDAIYYYGGETLRSDFYSGAIWRYECCTPHSIFISQASYPIKGLHMLLRALPLVLRHYPDTKLRIGGYDISRSQGGQEMLKISDYGLIIRKLLNRYKLKETVSFEGLLDGEGMRNEYLGCNVFVCPSSIENSPNSLGEAQILGVPVIASYVGGIPDMMKGDEEHLYRFEEVEMLAYKIVQLFDKAGSVDTEQMRQEALRRHNPNNNVSDLLEVYNKVVGE